MARVLYWERPKKKEIKGTFDIYDIDKAVDDIKKTDTDKPFNNDKLT